MHSVTFFKPMQQWACITIKHTILISQTNICLAEKKCKLASYALFCGTDNSRLFKYPNYIVFPEVSFLDMVELLFLDMVELLSTFAMSPLLIACACSRWG
jgi:hypothetical protein